MSMSIGLGLHKMKKKFKPSRNIRLIWSLGVINAAILCHVVEWTIAKKKDNIPK